MGVPEPAEVLMQVDFEVFGNVQGNFSNWFRPPTLWWHFCAIYLIVLLRSSIILIINFSVLGCGFTKYCRENCVQFGIRGWVKNSKRGTVMGKMQGPKAEVAKM